MRAQKLANMKPRKAFVWVGLSIPALFIVLLIAMNYYA